MADYEEGEKRKTETDEELLTQFREWYKQANEADSDQRRREREAIRFTWPEGQWTDAAKQERRGGNGLPQRPMPQVDLTQQPKQLVMNQAQAADLGVNIHPVSETASAEHAEILQGLYRRDERDSGAEEVRLWALDRVVTAGRGYYRLLAEYDEDSDFEFDQKLAFRRILYQESVLWDPKAEKSDNSDANYCFILSWMRTADFKKKYPKAKKSVGDGGSLVDLATSTPGWVKAESGGTILVAECWYKRKEMESLTEKDESGEPIKEARTRKREKTTVWAYTITGAEILEAAETDIPWIPVITIPGRELQPVDGQRCIQGMIEPAMDGQRIANFAAASMIERVSLEPKAPWVMAEGQDVGYEDMWRQSNTRNFSVLKYRTVDLEGKPVPPPQRAQIDQTGTSLGMMLWQEGKGFVQASTAVYEPSLGESPKRGQSGRAVIAQQQQSDAGTSNYLQNLANIAMPYEAKVYLAWAPYIYDRPGRVEQILFGEEEKPKAVMLNAPFVTDENGRPMPAQQGAPGAQYYDLKKGGKYSVTVSIGKSYQTRMQQGQDALGGLLEKLPPDLQLLLLPTMLKFQDAPGTKEAADLIRKYRDSKFPGITGDDENGPTPDQLKGQLAALGQQMKDMGQQLQLAIEQIKTDQAKQGAMLEKARIDAETKIRLADMDNAAKIAVAQIAASTKVGLMASEAQNEALATGLEHAHEAELAHQDRSHEMGLAAAGAQHAQGQTAMGQEHEAGMQGSAQDAQAQAAEQARQAAAEQVALQPQGGAE